MLTYGVIRTFRNKDLAALWETGKSRIDVRMHKRIVLRLDAVDLALSLEDMNVPGFNFHPLRGKPQRYSIHVNGPWCLTFEFENGDAVRVDFEQYH